MIDRVEERAYVGIYYPGIPTPNGLLYHLQGGRATASRPKAVTAVAEYSLEDRFEHLAECLLHDPISNGGNTKRPLPSCALGNEGPSYRNRTVGLLAQVQAQLLQPISHVTGELLDSDLIDPCRAVVFGHLLPSLV